jgi:sugar lactone lactonase YvrE
MNDVMTNQGNWMIATLDPGPFALAEGPLFDERSNALLWVDIWGQSILRRELDGTQTVRTLVGEDVGCIALTADRDVVIGALRSGWYEVNLTDGKRSLLAAPRHKAPTYRFNDGAVDSNGRLWTGSLEDGESDPVGELYCLDRDGQFRSADGGFIASNGIDWSPNGESMYLVDSRKSVIYRYAFEAASGQLGRREPFVDTSGLQGLPDGIAVDAEGTVWCAFWDGAAIHGFNEAGSLVETIELPVFRPTSVAFGGENLTVMFVTSASVAPSQALEGNWPVTGAVLMLNARCPGQRANVFGVSPTES